MTRKASPKAGSGSNERGDVQTYQDVLDEAIEETFPASDPIAPAVANAGAPVSTRRNPTDWKLEHRTESDGAKTGAGKTRAAQPVKSTLDSMPSRRSVAGAEIETVYQALKHGRGREGVTDANVDALIELARERADTELEVLLREWRSRCGDDPAMPAKP